MTTRPELQGTWKIAAADTSLALHETGDDAAPGASQDSVDPLNRFLENVLDAIDDDVFVKDDQHRWVVLNKAACRLLGRPHPDLIGKSDSDVFPSTQAWLHRKTDQEVLLNGETLSYEWSIERDGRQKTFLAKKSLLIDSSTGRRYVAGVARDISDLKAAQRALHFEKERALVTLQAIDNGVIRLGPLFAVEYMNPVAETLTGWLSNEVEGLPVASVFRVLDESSRQPLLDSVCPYDLRAAEPWPRSDAVLLDRSGREHFVEQSASWIIGRDGEVLGAVVVFRDVTERRRIERKLKHDAAHDSLTGLLNRRHFESRLEKAVISAKRFNGQHALCFFDLDKFKLVNDTVGHAAGDKLLQQIKRLLSGSFRDRDTLARLGGDEFGLLLENCPVDEAAGIAETIASKLKGFEFRCNGATFQVGTSVGVVPITAATESATEALSQADAACYAAKEMGGGQVHVCGSDSTLPQRGGQLVLASTLQDALNRNALCLYSQPIFGLAQPDGAPVQHEILVRLQDRDRIVLPSAFIRPAERYGLMAAIDRWVIQSALSFLFDGQSDHPRLEIAINISGNSLNDDGFLKFLDRTLTHAHVDPQQICFEITETAAIRNLKKTARLLAEIKEIGFQLSLDDFGSGLSSFKYLKYLPVDFLKIDGSFIVEMAENAVDFHMVEAINEVGHVLGMRTIAECVETDVTLKYLSDMNVDMAQGHALGWPEPITHLSQQNRVSVS